MSLTKKEKKKQNQMIDRINLNYTITGMIVILIIILMITQPWNNYIKKDSLEGFCLEWENPEPFITLFNGKEGTYTRHEQMEFSTDCKEELKNWNYKNTRTEYEIYSNKCIITFDEETTKSKYTRCVCEFIKKTECKNKVLVVKQ